MGRRRLGVLAAVAAVAVAPPAAEARHRTVPGTLEALAAQGRITPEAHRDHLAEWRRARRGVRRLDGAERASLAAVLGHARVLARRRMLGARVAPVFATVEVNRRWFGTRRRGVVPSGRRRRFAGSRMLFEFRAGSGWQLHPLASAGRLNALARSRATSPATLADFADDLLEVSVERKGFLALEYLFPYAGGRPGWISGMASATAISALARVWQRTGDERYRAAGERMLGAFATPPPWGVRVERAEGHAHYLLYSQSPGLLVGNGFAQALVGLHEFATVTGSSAAAALLEDGLRQAVRRMRYYDTGDWSLYWRRPDTRRGAESSLHYHRVFREFLAELCRRFPGYDFCELEQRFLRYESEPVRIGRLRVRRRGRRLVVRVWTSKPGAATLELRRGSRVRRRAYHVLRRGSHRVTWPTPRRGMYRLRIDARSPTGVTSARERRVRVR